MDKKRPVPTQAHSFPCMLLTLPSRYLRWEHKGQPELFFWLRPTLSTPQGTVMPDAIVCAHAQGTTTWVALELDEEPTPSAESLERERRIPLPTIRVCPRQMRQGGLVDHILAKLRCLMTPAA